jgi:hypothetical protein
MPTNVFFSPKVRTEQNLYEDIIIESIRMYGQDVYYLPRSIVQRDFILGEDVESQFNSANTIEVFIENMEGFEGQGNIFQKFGMEIRDEVTFVMAKRSWQKLVGLYNSATTSERPAEGDLIYLPLSKSFFEIAFVEHEAPFYQLSNLPTYKIQARLFEFNEEEFNTGIAAIDGIESTHGYQEVIEYGSVSGVFELGERIKYITTAAAYSNATATADFGVSRGIGDLESINIVRPGFGYLTGNIVTIQDHDLNDKVLEGTVANSTITRTFGFWSLYSPNDTTYYNVALPNGRIQGTAEFFFKPKASGLYNGNIAVFGDFKFNLQNSQIVSYFKDASAATVIDTAAWHHVKVSVVDNGTNSDYQIFINGARVANGNVAAADIVLCGIGGYHNAENTIKFTGANSSTNTVETNGIYFDDTSVHSTGLNDTATITVPTTTVVGDVLNETFEPVRATASATLTSGVVTGYTLTEAGRFYTTLPSVSIVASTSPDITEVSLSSELITYDNNTMWINQIETTDGQYGAWAVGNTLLGATSGATATVTKVFDVASSVTDNTFLNDPSARNFNLEEEADSIIDFSESNPFGDPSEGS